MALELPWVRTRASRPNPQGHDDSQLTMDLTGLKLQLGAVQITICLDVPASIHQLMLVSVDAAQLGLSQPAVSSVAC